jgi:hypothetical protein
MIFQLQGYEFLRDHNDMDSTVVCSILIFYYNYYYHKM